MTSLACLETWPDDAPGGPAVSHPTKPGTMAELDGLGGPEFEDIVAAPVAAPQLPPYGPQIRNRVSMRGFLDEALYFVRPTDVVKRKHVISADELRTRLGLAADQGLVLLLFDRDEVLEEMWARQGHLVHQLAGAGYDSIVSPSFSTYSPRPATEFLIDAKRGLIYFRALQLAGAHAIPRVAWEIEHDAERFATWVIANPGIEIVALDWGTYRSTRDWRAQLEGLVHFDRRTGRKLTFLINGVTTMARAAALFAAVPPARVRITNATTQARIPSPDIRPNGDQTGRTFAARTAVRREPIEAAAARYLRDPVQEHRAA